MGVELRLPKINASTEREQLVQIKSYLYQLVSQLQWAMNNIEGSQLQQNVVVMNTSAPTTARAVAMDAQSSFDSIKTLIIKSADIIDAYYEEVDKKLEGEYVAQSSFGIFAETTEQQISETSAYNESLYKHIQEIITEIDTLEHRLIEVDAHVRSGLLYFNEDSIPIYGLEIGQKNVIDGEEVFNKFARFTSDRLSFYDQNDTEVAYISDYKLYITNAEITGTLKLGGFMLDTRKGLTLKWVGRG